MKFHKTGGPREESITPFAIPYATLSQVALLGFRKQTHRLGAEIVARMGNPAWFNVLCADRIGCKNFMLRIESLELFAQGALGLLTPRAVHHTKIIAVKWARTATDGGEF